MKTIPMTVLIAVSMMWMNAHAATFTVTTTNDTGAGSLRDAIDQANATNGVDTIAFAIPGAGPHTITPSGTMPSITDPVIIDGYTQAGSSSNTLATGCDAVLKIELNFVNANGGLAISAGNSKVRGLVLNRSGAGGAAGAGIWLNTLGSNVVEGCFLGTDTTGLLARGNAEGVIAVSPSGNNLIGGINPGARNVISGNGSIGVDLRSATNTVQGNFIGVDRTGTNMLGNTGYGVYVFIHPAMGPITNAFNLIGGDAPGAANIIGGNNGPGIVLSQDGPPLQTQIKGNFIGTDFTGTRDLGNQTDGITCGAFFDSGLAQNVIGDTAPNVIAFNKAYGIQVGTGAGNLIAGNVIYSNVQAGVSIPIYLSGNSNNTITANSIFNNVQLGITLNNDINPVPNDPCDTDTGSNHLQNYPVITAATSDVSSVTIAGFLDSTANKAFDLEFFANAACDPKGFGEGEIFLGTTNVTTGANCTNNFSVTFPIPVPGGLFITATATDPDGNTSEFSKCFTNVSTAVTIDCSLTPQADTNTVGQTHIVTATITTNGTPVAGLEVSFSVSGAHTIAATNVTTAGNGQAQFSYLGTNIDTDTILAAGGIGGSEFSCDATKVWISAPPTNQPPVAVCQDVTTNANGSCQANVTAARVDNGSSDPDGISVTLSLSPVGPYSLGTNAVTLIAVDANSATDTCQAAIIVLDQTEPTITCPSDITTNVVAGQTNAVVNYPAPTVSDNCSVASTNSVPASGSSFALGTNTVTSAATDGSGNTNSCTFRIIVTAAASNQPPVAACRNVTTNANASCQATVPATAVDNGSTDSDGSITNRTLSPTGQYGLGTNNVTLTVVDDDGASNSCAAVIIVVDSTPPSITCPSGITTNVAAGQTTAVVNYPAPTVSDNCSVISTNCVPASGSIFALGTNTVTCTATDGSGNTNQCSFTVTVQEAACGVDLTGTWTNLVQTCKFKNEVPSCKVKGTLNVEDIGTEDAPTSFVRYYLSDDDAFDKADTLLKQVATGSVKLEKVKKRTLSAKLPVGIDGTGKYIIAVIDADEQIAECNEANNIIVFGPLP